MHSPAAQDLKKFVARLVQQGLTLDASSDIRVAIEPIDWKGAVRGDPARCVVARACVRRGLRAVVLRSVTRVLGIATEELIAHNRALNGEARVRGIRQGDLVVIRYDNGTAASEIVRYLDDSEKESKQPTSSSFVLLAPKVNLVARDRRSSSRRERADARRDGAVPASKRRARAAQLGRVASLRQAVAGD